MSTYTITATRSGTFNGMDWEAEYEITFAFTRGSADFWNKTGGHWEQGWAPEVELVSVKPTIGIVDAGAFTDLAQKDIEDWASEWLQDKGYDEALAVVAEDDEHSREYAAELRADR